MTFEDCLEKGLIKKSDTASEKVRQALTLGDTFLKSAEHNLEMGEYVVCELIAYNALFHCARAMLFSKGYIERSHACLFLALKKLYPETTELIARADKIRIERHNLQYGGFATDAQAASFILEFVREFRTFAKKMIK